MLVKIGNDTIHITWEHKHPEGITKGYTKCTISKLLEEGKPRQIICVGSTDCMPPDQYDKNYGRKLSMSRALTARIPNLDEPNTKKWKRLFSKDDSALIWKAYHTMRGDAF